MCVSALSVAFWGVKSFKLSFVICQILLLYKFIAELNTNFVSFIINILSRNKYMVYEEIVYIGNFISSFTEIIIAILISLLLYHFYQVPYRRMLSITGRITHTLCYFILSHILKNKMAIFIFNFSLNKVCNYVNIAIYFRNSKYVVISYLAFIGCYYFLKLSHELFFINRIILYRFKFSYNGDGTDDLEHLIICYCSFIIMFMIAFRIQSIFYKDKRTKRTKFILATKENEINFSNKSL